jgi:hypothetical protein
MAGAMRHPEYDQAVALIQWRDTYAKRYPQLALLIHIPNGGKRNVREAARLKRMGVRAGVSDYFLPVVRPYAEPADCSGFWIELKAGKGKPTAAQLEWLVLMRNQGYLTLLATGWQEAARAICDYLGLTGSVRP